MEQMLLIKADWFDCFLLVLLSGYSKMKILREPSIIYYAAP